MFGWHQRRQHAILPLHWAAAIMLLASSATGSARIGETLDSLKGLLDEIGYDGWCTVEQDCAPDAKISKVELARANREYLASVGI